MNPGSLTMPGAGLLALLLAAVPSGVLGAGDAVHFASVCRAGEVSSGSAVISTRLAAEPERHWNGIVPSPPLSPPRVLSPSPDIPADRWLKGSLLESDATFRILIIPTPIVGRDNAARADNHANKPHRTESQEFRDWVRAQRLDNLIVLTGDRRWQYASVDPRPGLREFSCGPAADASALKGPGVDPDFHSFYREARGFITVAIRRSTRRMPANPQRIAVEDGVPFLPVRIPDVDGRALHEFRDVGRE